MICKACYDKRRNGEVKCTLRGCTKSIKNKKWQLCKWHNEDRLAPKLLSEYIKSYASPFPQNVRYFLALAAKSRVPHGNTYETTVRAIDLRRYRAIGGYLKIYELPEILTWRAIHEALPKLSNRGRVRSKFIRSGLLELGNLLLQERLLPDWNSYLCEQRLDKYLKSAPPRLVEHVAAFEKWASEGMLNPKLDIKLHESQPLTITTDSILEIVKAAVIFIDWCVKRNICTLAEINWSTVASYKESLFWQQECRECRKRISLDFPRTSEICNNEECQAVNSYVKIRRLVRASVNRYTMNLRTFFNWAQLHDVVPENPFAYDNDKTPIGTFTVMDEQGQMVEISDSIRRYDDDVVERLCSYIVSPDADPEEALVLYLIIFHLLTATELRNAKIPSLAAAAEKPPGDCDRTKDFEYLLLPVRKRSRGRHSPRRDGPIMKFPKEAAYWLVPLLERYFEKRRSGRNSEYLFVGQFHLTRNNMPINQKYFCQLVHRASRRVLNGTVNPRDLRVTAAAIMAQRSKRRGAILTKLGYKSLRATRYNHLETFLLAPSTSTKQRQPPAGA
jgi:site-specific recombinase XerD